MSLNEIEMFAPLIKKTKNNECILAQYMFMYMDERNRFYYKHKDTRDYLVLSKRGRVIKGKVTDFTF